MAECPHGDATCPCPNGDPCHYEGLDAFMCPNPPLGFKGLVNPHCHMEGCEWHLSGCAGRPSREDGVCGLHKLSPEKTAFHLPVPGSFEWACGWLRNYDNLPEFCFPDRTPTETEDR